MLVRPLRALGAWLQRAPRPAVWLLVAIWYALIWYLSSRPAVILARPWYESVLSNLAHAPLFGLLSLWLVLLVARRDGWPELTHARTAGVLAVVLALGVVDELHQHFTPNRSMSLADLITDVTGAAAVLAVVRHLGRERRSDSGLAVRLALGLLACVIAAGNATFLSRTFPKSSWL